MATDIEYKLSIKDANVLSTLNEVVNRVKEVNKDFKVLEKLNLGRVDAEVKDATKEIHKLERAADEAADAIADIDATVKVEVEGEDKLSNLGKSVPKGGSGDGGKVGMLSDAMGSITDKLGSATGGILDFSGGLGSVGLAAGAATAGVAIAGAAIAAIGADAMKGAAEMNNLKKALSSQTGLKGTELSQAAIDIKALSEVYGHDEEQLMKTINAVSKNRGLTFAEASKLVEDEMNGGMTADALQWWGEYDVQLKKVGLTAGETAGFIKYAQQQGMHEDKAADALKEAQLRMSEFNDETRSSLQVLGKDYAAGLESDMKLGKKTLYEIMSSIADRSQELKLSSQDTQKLTAGLFSAAGEDAGRMLEVISGYNRVLAAGKAPQTEQQKNTEKLVEANKELASQYEKIGSATKGSGTILETMWIKMKAGVMSAVVAIMPAVDGVIKFFSDLIKASDPVVDVFSDVWEIVKAFGQELWGLVTDLLPSFSSSSGVATSIMEGLGVVIDWVTMSGRAFYAVLRLNVLAIRTLINSAKQLLNIFGAKFTINPELSFDNFKKEVGKFGELAKNGFRLDEEEGGKEEKKPKEAPKEETREKFKAVAGGEKGEEEKYEIKLTADTKPFEEAIKKVKDELRVLGEQSVIKEIQFKASIDEISLNRTTELIERSKLESDQKIAKIQFEQSIEQSRREVEERRKVAIEALGKGKEEELKSISELKSEALKISKRKELEVKYRTELSKIESESDKDRLTQEEIYIIKRKEMYIEQARALELIQIKTIHDQKRSIEESIKAQGEKQKQIMSTILGDSQAFELRREFELKVTMSNRGDIEKGMNAELDKIDLSIAEFQKRVSAGGGVKDIEILRNLQRQRLNIIIDADTKIVEEQIRYTEVQHKLTQQELTIQKDKFEKQVEGVSKFIGQMNESYEKMNNAYSEFTSGLDANQLKLNTSASMVVFQKLSSSIRGSLDGIMAKYNQIKGTKFEISEVSLNAEGFQKQIDIIGGVISDYNQKLHDAYMSGASEDVVDGIKKQISGYKEQVRALSEQRKLLVGKSIDLQQALDMIQENKRNTKSALKSGIDVSTGEPLDPEQIERGKEWLGELDQQEEEVKKKMKDQHDRLEKLLKDKKKLIKEFAISTAEVIGNAVLDALKAGTQATIDSIDIMLERQQEKIEEMKDALVEGGDAAKNYSVEQLEIEENRAEELKKQREEEAAQMQSYAMMQVAFNGAIAIARTFAEYPFPISLGVAALQIASIVGMIAVMSAQAKTIKAERGILDINSDKVNSKGVIQGRRHSEGGVMIEAEGGETIISRKNTQKYYSILERIHNSGIDKTQLDAINNILVGRSRVDIRLPRVDNQRFINAAKTEVKIIDENRDVVFQLRALRNDIKQWERNVGDRKVVIVASDDRMRKKTSNI